MFIRPRFGLSHSWQSSCWCWCTLPCTERFFVCILSFWHPHTICRFRTISSALGKLLHLIKCVSLCPLESRCSENDNVHRLHGRDLPGWQAHWPVELQGATGRLQRLCGQVTINSQCFSCKRHFTERRRVKGPQPLWCHKVFPTRLRFQKDDCCNLF